MKNTICTPSSVGRFLELTMEDSIYALAFVVDFGR